MQVYACCKVDDAVIGCGGLSVVGVVILALTQVILHACWHVGVATHTMSEVGEGIAHIDIPTRGWHLGQVFALQRIAEESATDKREVVLDVQILDGVNVDAYLAAYETGIALAILKLGHLFAPSARAWEEHIVADAIPEQRCLDIDEVGGVV